jgi:hypothetical protein
MGFFGWCLKVLFRQKSEKQRKKAITIQARYTCDLYQDAISTSSELIGPWIDLESRSNKTS